MPIRQYVEKEFFYASSLHPLGSAAKNARMAITCYRENARRVCAFAWFQRRDRGNFTPPGC